MTVHYTVYCTQLTVTRTTTEHQCFMLFVSRTYLSPVSDIVLILSSCNFAVVNAYNIAVFPPFSSTGKEQFKFGSYVHPYVFSTPIVGETKCLLFRVVSCEFLNRFKYISWPQGWFSEHFDKLSWNVNSSFCLGNRTLHSERHTCWASFLFSLLENHSLRLALVQF